MAWFRRDASPSQPASGATVPVELRGGCRLPPRGRYEADATVFQRRKLEKFGGQDHELMDLLGRDQAEYLIHHLEMEAWERQDENQWDESRNFVSRAAMTFCGVVFIIVVALVVWDASQGGRFAAHPDPRQATVANPETPGRPVSASDPNALLRAMAEFKQAVADSKARAVRARPALGVAGSHLNTAFVARYQQLIREHSPRLDSSDWPERLADECARQMPASYQ